MAAAASSVIDYFLQRSLDDLIKGLRGGQSSVAESRYISRALEEIRKEIRSTDPHTKSTALHKLLYLSSLHGTEIAWAAFHVVEVMSYPRFSHKRIGYLAASQSFTESTEVLLLTTNLLRKDLSSKNELEAGLALSCMASIATPDLARDLVSEIFTMLASSKIYIRKKATMLLLKVFRKHPEAIRVAFKRLVEKLEDPEPQVVAAAVTVLHELARDDPRPYLPLAPELHRLLVESTNNWLLIKVVKLFSLLMPLEPRLAKKVAEPLCQQMMRTSAKSLIVECIKTVSSGVLAEHPRCLELASEKLRELLGEDEDDPNLRFLGLKLLLDFLPSHPSLVSENKSVIVRCLSDPDPSIQRGSLRLIVGMISDANLADTVEILTRFARSSDVGFCNELVAAILSTCGRDFYELVSDFSWYVGVLGELARLPGFEQGLEVERQLVDIGLRVESVRPELFRLARGILVDSPLWENHRVHRVLAAAAWIAGEFVGLASGDDDERLELVGALLQPRVRKLPATVQGVYLQAVLKVLVSFLATDEVRAADALTRLLEVIRENAGSMVSHVDTEVQERASNLFGLIDFVEERRSSGAGVGDLRELGRVFGVELGPVSQFAQQKVAIPPGLELLEDLREVKQALGYSEIVAGPDTSSLFSRREAKGSEPDEGAELLAKHRLKNETFYLPKDSRDASDDFPRAENSIQEQEQQEEQVPDEKLKLAEESLVWNKPRRSRARSVVVKLMDEEAPPFESPASTGKASLKDSVLSNAIRDVLSSKSMNHVGESSSHRPRPPRRKEKPADHHHHHHQKPIDHQQQQQQEKQPEQQQDPVEDLKRSKKHHRKRAKSPWKVAPQEPVVPDFLL